MNDVLIKILFKSTAIGSFPSSDVQKTLDFIFDTFEIPFWCQLPRLSKFEDMIVQFTQNLAGIKYDKRLEKFVFDINDFIFYEQIESLYLDYEQIIENNNFKNIDNYAITLPYSHSFEPYLNLVSKIKPVFAKGQITGPFTWATSLVDCDNRCCLYDETLRDVTLKTLILKSIWQIDKIKTASKSTKPIIFIDEPALSQFGTSSFITVEKSEVIDMITQISEQIKKHGALSAIHCCGKVDWDLILKTSVDIINLDAFSYAKTLAPYTKELNKFMEKGGVIAWGLVPTLDKTALEKASFDTLIEFFAENISYLIKKGLNSDLINTNSMFTPACGTGALSFDLAKKALILVNEISKYYQDCGKIK